VLSLPVVDPLEDVHRSLKPDDDRFKIFPFFGRSQGIDTCLYVINSSKVVVITASITSKDILCPGESFDNGLGRIPELLPSPVQQDAPSFLSTAFTLFNQIP